jgi:hypothetical protein
MGQQANCKVRVGGKVVLGKALLETEELIFRGSDLRLKIPFRQMSTIEAEDGWLRIDFPKGRAAFELGTQAAKWAHQIRNPKSRIDKLGVKAALRISLVGSTDVGFHQELRSRTDDITQGNAAPDSDLIFLSVEAQQDLARLRALPKSLKSNGAIWVIYPKGKEHITEAGVFAAGKQAGLVDVKVASFSPTETALKFVIPVAKRHRGSLRGAC